MFLCWVIHHSINWKEIIFKKQNLVKYGIFIKIWNYLFFLVLCLPLYYYLLFLLIFIVCEKEIWLLRFLFFKRYRTMGFQLFYCLVLNIFVLIYMIMENNCKFILIYILGPDKKIPRIGFNFVFDYFIVVFTLIF